ncbi:hypothetical protein CVV38_03745 [Candidatus Peregrinibacteria bacterium HGW-Peregrinibacteria-1]|jgi:phosphatidylglycerophosphate synthase|nr:MAG: hypothetical protein CVV38_03745 [Candidatus Peregrinibacteria bacterium HGW-Peregrinibacteria-1]
MNFLQSILSYIFSPNPGANFNYYGLFFGLSIGLIVVATVFHFYYQSQRKENLALKTSFRSLSRNLVIIAIVFLVLIGARYENISFFSMRLFLGLNILALVYLVYKSIKKYLTTYKENLAKNMSQHHNQKEKKSTRKYLPNKPRK